MKRAVRSQRPAVTRETAKNFCMQLVRRRHRVTVLIGNGINGESRTLSTAAIVSAFVRKASDANPRTYDVDKKQIKALAGDESPDMTKFLSCLGTADRMQSEFVGYVVEACCQEDPSTTHTLTLMLLHALTAGKPHHGLVAFTTNYDNLLERAYLRFLRKTSVYGRSSSRIRIDVGHMTSLAITRPTYTLRPTDVRRVVPVFPIHGCISLCRCPRCGRLLQTEAAALGQKMCVYCGCEIPPLVVPFREGGADKNVLSLLESEVGKADLCIFIGSSFGDPHILERIRRGLDHGQRRARLLNFCNAPIPADLANAKAGRDLDIQGDIHLGLVRFLDAYMEVADPETAVWINRAYSEAL